MYNPEFRYLIAEDEMENQQFIIFENSLDYIGAFCTMIILAIVVYNRIWLLSGFLSPGQEWIEMTLITVSIGLFIVCKLIADLILNELNDSFSKLKSKNKEKDKIIKELEENIKKLEKTMEQKDGFINELVNSRNELNVLNIELQQENHDLLREAEFLKQSFIEEIRKDDEEFAYINNKLKTMSSEWFNDESIKV
jgi:hypothetical protein